MTARSNTVYSNEDSMTLAGLVTGVEAGTRVPFPSSARTLRDRALLVLGGFLSLHKEQEEITREIDSLPLGIRNAVGVKEDTSNAEAVRLLVRYLTEQDGGQR